MSLPPFINYSKYAIVSYLNFTHELKNSFFDSKSGNPEYSDRKMNNKLIYSTFQKADEIATLCNNVLPINSTDFNSIHSSVFSTSSVASSGKAEAVSLNLSFNSGQFGVNSSFKIDLFM